MAKPLQKKEYQKFLIEVKETIQKQQVEAFRKVNQTLLELYWQIGEKIAQKQEELKWGKSVVHKLSEDLQKDFPGIRGFSSQNLWRMYNFYLAYHHKDRLKALLSAVGWSHHIVILTKVKEDIAREYYLRATARFGWTKNILAHKIDTGDFERFALSHSNNFSQTLPEPAQKQAKLAIKDHYMFDFLEMGDDFAERELEEELIQHMQQFIMELGIGEFAFLGRQFKIEVAGEEFFIDLLFYQRTLKSLFAVELKVKKFEPEYIGKMNFYLSALDNQVRKEGENPSIGLILCREKNKTMVEYSFANFTKPMGVATYSLENSLPPQYKGLLPSPEVLHQEMEQWEKKKLASQHPQITGTGSEKEIPIPPRKTVRTTARVTAKAAKKKAPLKARQLRFLKSAKVGERVSTSLYASRLNISSATAQRDLKDLEDRTMVRRLGKGRNTVFEIVWLEKTDSAGK